MFCPDGKRRGEYPHTSFTFLGYTFALRPARTKDGTFYVGFGAAVSRDALTAMARQVRRWRLHLWTERSLDELATWINPVVAGWMNYYGRYFRSKLSPLLQRINTYLMRWAGRKYKRLRSYKRLKAWWLGLLDREPKLIRALAMGARIRRIPMRRAE